MAGDVKTETQGFTTGIFSIDEYRPMKIIAIGAGMSGILAAIRYSVLNFALGPFHLTFVRFRQHIKNLDLTVYEKEDRVGGTWYVNRYP